MELFEAINSRASALRLAEPSPSREQITKILEAGACAPDHGKLRPWHFIVLQGEAIRKFGDAMAAGLKARRPDAAEDVLDSERRKAARAPTLIVVGVKLVDKGDKVPGVEQLLAAGATAENMFLAAHAMGLGMMWKTGPAAYDPVVKQAVGLAPEDHIVAILYLGTPAAPGKPRPPMLEGRVTWM